MCDIDENVDDRSDQHHDRGDHAEEQKGDVRSLTAISRHDEFFARGLLSHPLAEIEIVHDL